jgi:hypothetical protein
MFAGCAGGSGGSTGASPAGPAGAPVTAHFSFVVSGQATSASVRRATYISPSSQSVEIDVAYGSASTVGAQLNLSPLPAACSVSGGVTTCDLAVVAQASATDFIITFYDQPNEGGNVLSTATVPVPVAVDGVANVSATLLPVVANAELAPATALVSGTPQTTTLVFTALDADGNPISGSVPFSAPVQLTPSSPAITFTPSTITSPATVVTITYNGAPITSSAVVGQTGTKTFTTQLGVPVTGLISPADIQVTVGEPGVPVVVSASGTSGTVTLVAACVDGAQISLSQNTAPVGTATSITVQGLVAPSGSPTHACTITATAGAQTGTTFVDVNQNTANINSLKRRTR